MKALKEKEFSYEQDYNKKYTSIPNWPTMKSLSFLLSFRFKILKEDFDKLISEKGSQLDVKQEEISNLKTSLLNIKYDVKSYN